MKLGEVMRHRKGSIVIDDSVDYKLCRVQVNRRGVVLRGTVKGSLIRTKKQQICKAGDFLVAEMDAKVGGYGFVPKELDGAIVSSHYFLFELDESKIRPRFLEVVSKLGILQEQIKAVGSTNYAAIRPANVLQWEIPSLDIDHQKKVEQLYDSVSDTSQVLSAELTHQLDLVKQLRQAFLREAMQGKLVPQDPNDEPASELLKRIKTEKEKLIRQGKLKKEKPLPPIKPEEIPFEIPKGWVWCRLGDLRNYDYSLSYGVLVPGNDVKDGVPFVRVQDLDSANGNSQPSKSIAQSVSRKYEKTLLVGGEILICVVGSIGKITIAPNSWAGANIARAVCRLMPNKQIESYFLLYCLTSPYVLEVFQRETKSINPTLNVGVLEKVAIPLPPLVEQMRIVAKLDHLMRNCDELNASIKQSQTQNEQLLQQVLREAFGPGTSSVQV